MGGGDACAACVALGGGESSAVAAAGTARPVRRPRRRDNGTFEVGVELALAAGPGVPSASTFGDVVSSSGLSGGLSGTVRRTLARRARGPEDGIGPAVGIARRPHVDVSMSMWLGGAPRQ